MVFDFCYESSNFVILCYHSSMFVMIVNKFTGHINVSRVLQDALIEKPGMAKPGV